MHRTRSSALMMSAAMDHEIDVPGRVEFATDAREDLARTTVICGLRAGQKLRIVKYLAYGWSSMRSRPALRDQAAAAIHSARYSGWQGLLDAQRAYLDDYLGQRGRRGRGRSRIPAGRAVRAFSPAAGQRARRAPRDSRPRGSPAPATTVTPSGTPRGTCCRCSPTPRRMRWPTRCGGGRRPWTSPRNGRPNSASRAPPFPGGPSAGRSARPTGRPAPRPGTSTPTSPWPSSATASSPATTSWKSIAASRCSSRPPGSGSPSATTTGTASGTSTASPAPTSTRRSCATTSSPT